MLAFRTICSVMKRIHSSLYDSTNCLLYGTVVLYLTTNVELDTCTSGFFSNQKLSYGWRHFTAEGNKLFASTDGCDGIHQINEQQLAYSFYMSSDGPICLIQFSENHYAGIVMHVVLNGFVRVLT